MIPASRSRAHYLSDFLLEIHQIWCGSVPYSSRADYLFDFELNMDEIPYESSLELQSIFFDGFFVRNGRIWYESSLDL